MLLPSTVGMNGRTPTIPLAADMGLDAAYSGTQAGSPTSVTITIKSDGTWEITFGAGDTPAGTPTSGNWASATLAGIGNEYQVLITKSNLINSPGGGNDASDWTTVSGDVVAAVTKSTANASADLQFSFRSVFGGSTGMTDTTNFAANGA